jgi:hypothetical protein
MMQEQVAGVIATVTGELGDCAVQIRAKMMTLPGEQFVIRRQATL